MEEAELLIKELRIDNESLLSSDFNPLLAMPQSEYRNIYHRVEKVMEGIINITYKGFSDSVLSYMEIYNLNKKNVTNLNESVIKLNNIKNISINTADIRKIYEKSNYLKIKLDISDILNVINDKYSQVKSASLVTKFNLLLQIKNIINTNKLGVIEGIELVKNDVIMELDHCLRLIFEKVGDYVYKDKVEHKELLRIIKVMDKSKEFMKYINKRVGEAYEDNLKAVNEYLNLNISLRKEKNVEKIEDIFYLEDSAFIKVDYENDTLICYKYKDHASYLIKRIKEVYKTRPVNYFVINTLFKLQEDNLANVYLDSICLTIEEELFYLFDTILRDRSDYYINKIVYNINKNIQIINMRPQIVKKLLDKINETERFEKLLLLDEILSEYY